MENYKVITEILDNVGSIGAMGILIYLMVTGKLHTNGEVQRIVESEKRAWEQRDKLQETLQENMNQTYKLLEGFREMRSVLESIVRTSERR